MKDLKQQEKMLKDQREKLKKLEEQIERQKIKIQTELGKEIISVLNLDYNTIDGKKIKEIGVVLMMSYHHQSETEEPEPINIITVDDTSYGE